MKIIEKTVDKKGHIKLLCEESKLFGLLKTKKQFVATEENPKGFWNWKRALDQSTVDEITAFKLDNKCNNDPLFFGIEDFILYTSFECPFKKALDTCALKGIREIEDLDERAQYIKGLTEKEKKQIYSYHKNCIAERKMALLNSLYF